MTSRAQKQLVRGRSHSKNLTFQLRRVNKCNEKRASDHETKKNQEHSNIDPLSLQLRSYNKEQDILQKNYPPRAFEFLSRFVESYI